MDCVVSPPLQRKNAQRQKAEMRDIETWQTVWNAWSNADNQFEADQQCSKPLKCRSSSYQIPLHEQNHCDLECVSYRRVEHGSHICGLSPGYLYGPRLSAVGVK